MRVRACVCMCVPDMTGLTSGGDSARLVLPPLVPAPWDTSVLLSLLCDVAALGPVTPPAIADSTRATASRRTITSWYLTCGHSREAEQ